MRRLILLLAAVALTACGSDTPTVCPSDLRWTVTPPDTTVAPGGQLSMRVTLLGCAGTVVLRDAITWSSTDTTVATVDATTGAVRALRAGSTLISPTGRTFGSIPGSRITVR